MNVNMNDSFTKCLTATGNLINLMQHKRIFFFIYFQNMTHATLERKHTYICMKLCTYRVRQKTSFFLENALKKTTKFFAKKNFFFFLKVQFFLLVMENNFLQMAASAVHAVVYTICPIFKIFKKLGPNLRV